MSYPEVTLLRWMIARKLDSDSSKETEDLESQGALDTFVTIHRLRKDHLPMVNLTDITKEDMDWWDIGFNREIQGWVDSTKLLEILKTRNLRSNDLSYTNESISRSIYEGMVFIQILDDSSCIDEKWVTKEIRNPFTDANELMNVPGAKWIDFTQPAREASKEIYTKLISSEEVESNEKEQ